MEDIVSRSTVLYPMYLQKSLIKATLVASHWTNWGSSILFSLSGFPNTSLKLIWMSPGISVRGRNTTHTQYKSILHTQYMSMLHLRQWHLVPCLNTHLDLTQSVTPGGILLQLLTHLNDRGLPVKLSDSNPNIAHSLDKKQPSSMSRNTGTPAPGCPNYTGRVILQVHIHASFIYRCYTHWW